MPKNEDGEFELILGNRQLLSVFFIVVILLGVFFTMGYIVGRNSAPVIATDSGRRNDTKPLVVDSTSKTPEPAPVTTAPKETAVQQPTEPAPEPPKPVETTKAEQPKPVTEPPAKETAKERKAEAKAKKEAAAAKMEKAKPAVTSSGSPSGTYLQLAATSEREAGIMVDVLKKKGFQAMASGIPEKPEIFRVLVGPVTDATVNKTRSDLQGAGFPGDKAIKRTF
jgi:cell division septation protein DedD